MMKSIFPVLAGIGLVLAGCNSSNNNSDNNSNDNNVSTTCTGTAVQPQRLFLQQLGSASVIIKWRGNAEDGAAEADSLCYGTDMAALPAGSMTEATVTATGHREVLISGLQPDTTYYYSVGGAGVANEGNYFRTAPVVGDLPPDGNTRIWLVGDSGVAGTSDPEAGFVRDGFMTFAKNNGDEPADLFLML